MMTPDAVKAYAATLAFTALDCPFRDDFVSTVMRHADTRKWFGLYMTVKGEHIGRNGTVDVLNVKVDPTLGSLLVGQYAWIIPSYHMNKRHWVSIILPEADEAVVRQLIDHSYALTSVRPKEKNRRKPATGAKSEAPNRK